MRKIPILVLALTAAMIPAIQQVQAASQPIEGVVTDSMCTKKHMMSGKSNAQCVAECVKDGASYALIAGSKVYKLTGKPETLAPFAGKHVQVEGTVNDNTIAVRAIHEAGAGMQGMPM